MDDSGKKSSVLLLPPMFLAPVGYYAAMAAFPRAVIDTSMRFNKRFKSPHRTTIADANGTSLVSVPIVKPESMTAARWDDIIVSAHNSWWNDAMTALRSAYGRTPFYEFYEDDFLEIINRDAAGKSLMSIDRELDQLVRRLAGITTKVEYGNPDELLGNASVVADCRSNPIDFVHAVEYYQVRSARHGFIPDMSIVDMLFNIGPESALVLRDMTE